MPKNYYLVLGIDSDASLPEIKAAFRRRARAVHPDHSGQESGPFLELQEAYRVLSDPARRRHYDRLSSSMLARPARPAPEPMVKQRPAGEPFRAGRAGLGIGRHEAAPFGMAAPDSVDRVRPRERRAPGFIPHRLR